MTMHLNLVGRRDLSGEIYRQIRRAILNGQLRPGEALTPSRELAQALAVSRSTVIVAYERPEINRFKGTNVLTAGFFVQWLTMDRFRRELARAQEYLKKRGK